MCGVFFLQIFSRFFNFLAARCEVLFSHRCTDFYILCEIFLKIKSVPFTISICCLYLLSNGL